MNRHHRHRRMAHRRLVASTVGTADTPAGHVATRVLTELAAARGRLTGADFVAVGRLVGRSSCTVRRWWGSLDATAPAGAGCSRVRGEVQP